MNQLILVQEEPRGPIQLVECPVVAGAQKQRLPDVQQLRSQEGQVIIIKGIRLISFKVLANAMTLLLPNAPLADLQNMCLILYSEGWEKGQMIPLLTLNDVNDSDAATATTIPFRNVATKLNNWRNVDWAQSYFLFANGQSASINFAVMLDVDYEKLNAQGNPIKGPS